MVVKLCNIHAKTTFFLVSRVGGKRRKLGPCHCVDLDKVYLDDNVRIIYKLFQYLT